MTPAERVEAMRPIEAEPSTPRLSRHDDRVLPAFLRFARLALLLPLIAISCTWLLKGLGAKLTFWLPITALAVVAVIGVRILGASMERALRPALGHGVAAERVGHLVSIAEHGFHAGECRVGQAGWAGRRRPALGVETEEDSRDHDYRGQRAKQDRPWANQTQTHPTS